MLQRIPYPHDIKGQGIYCYVTLMAGEKGDDALKTELRNWVRKEIGARPDAVRPRPAQDHRLGLRGSVHAGRWHRGDQPLEGRTRTTPSRQ
jgi:hypothetical protein